MFNLAQPLEERTWWASAAESLELLEFLTAMHLPQLQGASAGEASEAKVAWQEVLDGAFARFDESNSNVCGSFRCMRYERRRLQPQAKLAANALGRTACLKRSGAEREGLLLRRRVESARERAD